MAKSIESQLNNLPKPLPNTL